MELLPMALPNWLIIVAGVELTGLLVFGLSIATAIPEEVAAFSIADGERPARARVGGADETVSLDQNRIGRGRQAPHDYGVAA